MGRPLIHSVPPQHEASLFQCSVCTDTLPADTFYWQKSGYRNPECKGCYVIRQDAQFPERRARMVMRSGECESCGANFVTADYRKRFCNRTCKSKFRNRRAQDAINLLKPDRSCPHCGTSISRNRRVDAKFCSEACNSAAHQATRKARWRVGEAEYVSRAYIIARDRSICHLCGRKCRPGDIQIDHVIPVSLGGTHVASNLRVSHAACNLSKRADAWNEQLMLVG